MRLGPQVNTAAVAAHARESGSADVPAASAASQAGDPAGVNLMTAGPSRGNVTSAVHRDGAR